MSEQCCCSAALAEIPAALLVGGLGSRLRSAVADRPKALAEIAGRPFLAWMLDDLAAAGLRHIVLCTGYRGEMVEQAFGPRYGGLSLTYSFETSPLGTGGALRAALPHLNHRTVLVLNGDSFCRADLAVLARFHQQSAAAASLVAVHVADTARYGCVEMDEVGTITRFLEKGGPPGPGWINAGIYLFNRRVIESIPESGPVSLERDVFPAWIGRGLMGHRQEVAFLDIGTPETYAAAAEFLDRFTSPARPRGS